MNISLTHSGSNAYFKRCRASPHSRRTFVVPPAIARLAAFATHHRAASMPTASASGLDEARY
jgi:hypothetical protein